MTASSPPLKEELTQLSGGSNLGCPPPIIPFVPNNSTQAETESNFVAKCLYKQVVFSTEEIEKRLAEFNKTTQSIKQNNHKDQQRELEVPVVLANIESKISFDKSEQLKKSAKVNNKAADTNKVKTDKADTTTIDNTNSIENNQVNGTAPHVIEKVTETQQLINKKGVNLYGTFTRKKNLEEANISEEESQLDKCNLMLSREERQELAENAMEELATELHRAADAMKMTEETSDLAGLPDKDLQNLLEEAYNYKKTSTKSSHSGTFSELLDKVEENSSGEEQWDATFRRLNQELSGKKKKKKVSEQGNRGGSLSNLSLISDSDSHRSSKRKSGRASGGSSVSARPREGGSLPPTKFENVVCLGGSAAAAASSAAGAQSIWESGHNMMCEERVPGELLHSNSDSIIRRLETRDFAREYRTGTGGGDTCIDIENTDDTDSNKTEVEEIEMVDMENRVEYTEYDETNPLLQARHRMESRGRTNVGGVTSHVADEGIEMQSDWSSVRSITDSDRGDREDEKLDENGNPTSHNNSMFPIMEPNIRPFSIYRHTPVFQRQKLTVPSLPQTQQVEPTMNHTTTPSDKATKAKKLRRKKEEDKNVKKSEEIEGFRGNEDMDSILQFLGEDSENTNRKNRKSTDKESKADKNKKNAKKDDSGDTKRKKKEKSADKESLTAKKSLSKLNSVERCETVSESESTTMEKNKLETKDSLDLESGVSVRTEESTDFSAVQSCTTAGSTASSGRGSSGRGTCHTHELTGNNSASSNKALSVASSPPPDLYSTTRPSIAESPPPDLYARRSMDMDLMPGELLQEDGHAGSDLDTSREFTKVTKKKGKKKERSNRLGSGSVFREENRVRGEEVPARRTNNHNTQQQKESEDWTFRGYNRIRGSGEAITATKSTCSVPPSDASDTDDHDSVHSLPVGSTRAKVSAPTHSVSSGHTPQASYADIARHAAALHTQQAGQQRHDVYREHLQYRECTPGHTKESVSSTEGDSILCSGEEGGVGEDTNPHMLHSEQSQPYQAHQYNTSENHHQNSMEKVFPALREISPAAAAAKTDIVNPLLKDEYPPLLPTADGANTAVNDSTISVTKDNNDVNIVKTNPTVGVASQNNPVNPPNDSSLRRSQQPPVVACPNCSNQQLQQQQSSDSKQQLPSTSFNTSTQQQKLCNSMASDKNPINNKQQVVKGNASTTYNMPPPGAVSSSQIVNDKSKEKCKPNINCVQGTLNSSDHKISSTNRSANVSKQPSPAFSTSSSGSGSKKPPVVILSGDSQRRKEPQAVVNGVEDDVSGAISFGFDINPALLAATGPAAVDNFSTAAADGDENSSGDEEGSDTTVSCSGAESPVQQSINQSESSLSQSTATLCNAISVESVTASSAETLVPASANTNHNSMDDTQQVDWAAEEEDEPWYEEVGSESWCRDAAWCEDLEQSWADQIDAPRDSPVHGNSAVKPQRNFNYDVIVDFVKQAWDSVSCELSTTNHTNTLARVTYYHV